MIRADGFVKVLDFGLARQVDQAAVDRETTLTQFQTAAGVLHRHARVHGARAGKRLEWPARRRMSSPSGSCSTRWPPGAGRSWRATRAGVVAACSASSRFRRAPQSRRAGRRSNELVLRMLEKEPALRPTVREVEGALAMMRGGAVAIERPLPMAATRATTVGRESQRAQLARAYARVQPGEA